MTHQIPIRITAIQTDAMRADQIQSHTIIAQVIITRRLQRQYAATHNHLDLIQMRSAQDVLDDLLGSLGAGWNGQ